MNKRDLQNNLLVCCALVWALGTASTVAQNQQAPQKPLIAASAQGPDMLQIYVGESQKLSVNGVTKIVISDPEIVEVVPVTTTTLVLNAKKAGSTILTLFEKDQERMIRVIVAQNFVSLAMRIQGAIGHPGIRVVVAEQNLILEGQVETQDERNRAVTIASAYLPAIRAASNQQSSATAPPTSNVYNASTYSSDNRSEGDVSDAKAYTLPTPEGIIDFMEIRNMRQVRLRIQVVEMTKSGLKDFGLKFAEQAGYGIGYMEWIMGPGFDSTLAEAFRGLAHGTQTPPGSEEVLYDIAGPVEVPGSRGGYYPGDPSLGIAAARNPGWSQPTYGNAEARVRNGYSVALRTVENKGDAKILARPTLITLDGSECSFLAGGKVIMNLGIGDTSTPQTEEYGVKIFFRPKIMPNGRINLFVTPKYTDTPVELGNAFFINSRNTRNNVEIPSGGLLVLAGLLEVNHNFTVNKFPFLADIPIIGSLFKNPISNKRDKELLFFVFPEIVNNIENLVIKDKLPTELKDMEKFLKEYKVLELPEPADGAPKAELVNPPQKEEKTKKKEPSYKARSASVSSKGAVLRKGKFTLDTASSSGTSGADSYQPTPRAGDRLPQNAAPSAPVTNEEVKPSSGEPVVENELPQETVAAYHSE